MDPTRKKPRTESNADSAAMTSESVANMDISGSGDDDTNTDSAGMDTSPDTGGGGGDDDITKEWRDFFDKNEATFQTLEARKLYLKHIKIAGEVGAFIDNGTNLRDYLETQVRLKHLPENISVEQANEAFKILYSGIPQEWRDFFDKNEAQFQTLEKKKLYLKCFNNARDRGNFIDNGTKLRVYLEGLVINDMLPESISVEQANEAFEILYSERQSDDGTRGARIVDGLDRAREHDYDLNAFKSRIEDLFKWHNNETECKTYTAPYFALIQSSGMGKTKLLTEYRNSCKQMETDGAPAIEKVHCFTILCVSQDIRADLRKYYDHIRKFKPNPRDSVNQEMNQIINGVTGKIVLLFDEAQGLLEGKLFSDIRWWLREKRRNQNVVAVFAGTTAKLSNFLPPDGKPPSYSREVQPEYKNLGKEEQHILYPPFFRLHTISCLRKHETVTEAKFPDSVIYGRPLFAHYYIKNELDEGKLKHFANRLVLSSKGYEQSLPACYSVLGSRVQMGTVNCYDTLTELVSSGYACLTEFTKVGREARVTFMPDPLCAFLAMRLMNGSTAGELSGRENKFWVKKARRAFETKLCRPEKGDAGEIFAALYMLFCGDHLRKQEDDGLHTFSVKLNDWFHYVKSGGKNSIEVDEYPASKAEGTQNKEGIEIESTISFIQVSRNDYRSNPFFKQKFLEHLYLSGLGIYAYSNCPAFDIVSSIRVKSTHEDKTESKYHPLLVSVKNCDQATNSDVVTWVYNMKAFIEQHRVQGEPSAVCIILLLGCSVSSDEDNLDETNLSAFPQNDIYRLVSVPEDDNFGIFKAVQSLGGLSEESEIYSSHGFAACVASARNVLRASSRRQGEVTRLFEEIGDEEDDDGHAATTQP